MAKKQYKEGWPVQGELWSYKGLSRKTNYFLKGQVVKIKKRWTSKEGNKPKVYVTYLPHNALFYQGEKMSTFMKHFELL